MHRWTLLVLLFGFIAVYLYAGVTAPAPLLASTMGAGEVKAEVAVAALNVRSGPGTSYPRIGLVRRGQVYDILGRASTAARPWWLICCLPGGQQGWISGDYVAVRGDASAVLVASGVPVTATPQPTPQPPVGEWRASYFDDIHLAGSPLAVRNEHPIRFMLHRNWSLHSPIPGVVPDDNWSARWVGRFEFAAGDYYFELKSNYGGRLYLDEHLVIDDWKDGDSYAINRFGGVTAGLHTVTVEFYKRGGLAWVEANWSTTPPGSE